MILWAAAYPIGLYWYLRKPGLFNRYAWGILERRLKRRQRITLVGKSENRTTLDACFIRPATIRPGRTALESVITRIQVHQETSSARFLCELRFETSVIAAIPSKDDFSCAIDAALFESTKILQASLVGVDHFTFDHSTGGKGVPTPIEIRVSGRAIGQEFLFSQRQGDDPAAPSSGLSRLFTDNRETCVNRSGKKWPEFPDFGLQTHVLEMHLQLS